MGNIFFVVGNVLFITLLGKNYFTYSLAYGEIIFERSRVS